MKQAKSRKYYRVDLDTDKAYEFPRVSILSYCIMPTRYVCLLREESKNGVCDFLRLVQAGMSHYYRNLFKTSVPLFEDRYVKTEILTRSELHSASRFIHTLPALGTYVRDAHVTKYYPWSSYREIVEQSKCGVCDSAAIMEYYSSIQHYKRSIQKLPM